MILKGLNQFKKRFVNIVTQNFEYFFNEELSFQEMIQVSNYYMTISLDIFFAKFNVSYKVPVVDKSQFIKVST